MARVKEARTKAPARGRRGSKKRGTAEAANDETIASPADELHAELDNVGDGDLDEDDGGVAAGLDADAPPSDDALSDDAIDDGDIDEEGFDGAEDGEDLSAAEKLLSAKQGNARELAIRRAIEERREARRLKEDLDYLDLDD